MTRLIGNLAAVLCVVPSVLLAQSYYYTDNLTSINGSNWTQNGSVTPTSQGLTSTSSTTSGSLISKVSVPDGTSDYEVKVTLNLQPVYDVNGGNLYLYLRASSNALYNDASPYYGSGYVVELGGIECTPSSCLAGLGLRSMPGNGTYRWFGGTTVTVHNGSTIRAVYNHVYSELIVYVDNVPITSVQDSSFSSGQPGVGVFNNYTGYSYIGDTISQVQFATLYRGTPTLPALNQIGVTTTSTSVSLQWPAASDGSGPGLVYYQLFRDGALVQQSMSQSYFDPTLTPVKSYTYKLCAVDFHENTSCENIPVTTPAASGPITERGLGVRPNGSYWGSAGENIDMQSGNLSYSIPLIRAQGRGGWSVPINLIYNSLNWRQDSGGTWQLGADVGYGYGWKIQAGSLVSYSTPGGGVAYMFTDATGAEYLLTQNSGGIYSSLEGAYVSYDSNTGILHFNDGSFWVMGCVSVNNEADAGTLYPTTLEDSNGNQLS